MTMRTLDRPNFPMALLGLMATRSPMKRRKRRKLPGTPNIG
jgi:hypothetical protein